MDKNELYRIKDELLKSKAQDLEQIEDHKEYAMRTNELRAMQEQQRKQDAIKAAEPIKNTYEPKPIKNTYEPEEIKNTYEPKPIKNTYEPEEIKKHNR